MLVVECSFNPILKVEGLTDVIRGTWIKEYLFPTPYPIRLRGGDVFLEAALLPTWQSR